MKDVFYALLTWILIAILLIPSCEDIKHHIDEKYVGHVIIDKKDFYYFKEIKLLHLNYLNDNNENNIETILVYDIVYEKYNVGDTVKFEY